jgi:parallel beta-helix repeat protein
MGYGDSLFVVGAYSYVHHLKFNGNMDNQDDTPNGVYLLTDSRFENNEVFKVSAYMLGTYKGDNIIINNNIIHDTRQYGIATSGEGFPVVNDYSNNITITNNTIYNCGQVGIKIRQTSNSLVKGNIITVPTSLYDDVPAGIRLYTFDGANHHITITNNQISGPGDGSIAISSDDSANSYISITNNQIINADTGIKINFNNGIITGNSITYRSSCIANRGSGNTISGNSCN